MSPEFIASQYQYEEPMFRNATAIIPIVNFDCCLVPRLTIGHECVPAQPLPSQNSLQSFLLDILQSFQTMDIPNKPTIRCGIVFPRPVPFHSQNPVGRLKELVFDISALDQLIRDGSDLGCAVAHPSFDRIKGF